MQEYQDFDICEFDFACDDFPADCPEERQKDKDVRISINNPKKFDLCGAGNIRCRQLVRSPEKSTVCNWPEIVDCQFDVGYSSILEVYSLQIVRLPLPLKLRIGGRWFMNQDDQEFLTIPDKALMVFKIWCDDNVDKGDGGEEGRGSSRGDDAGSAAYIGDHYELYGDGWQRHDTAGYNGNVDVAAIADPDACAYYTFGTGESARLEILVHFPLSAQATSAAQYDVYVTEHFVGPAGEQALGQPVLTTVVDQSDADAYATAANDDGFISIGTFDVQVDETEYKSIAIRLSAAEGSSETESPSALLVSDAVTIKTLE